MYESSFTAARSALQAFRFVTPSIQHLRACGLAKEAIDKRHGLKKVPAVHEEDFMKATKTPSRLSDSLQHQLNMYALTASATGVGMLALALPAEAKIVYTPAHIRIKLNHGIINLDLNHDGINDFQFSAKYGRSTYGLGEKLWVGPAQQSNQVWGFVSTTWNALCADPLPRGQKVGPKGKFYPGVQIMFSLVGHMRDSGGWSKCAWYDTKAYLGLRFIIKGKTHYGWARVKTAGNFGGFTPLITGYAYETVPNKPIIAGRIKGADDGDAMPATLGGLALGRK
jgi:hypothetical protein